MPSADDHLGMYHVHLDGVKNGTHSLPGGVAMVDTGTTNLFVPPSVSPLRSFLVMSDRQLLHSMYISLEPDQHYWRQKSESGWSYMIPCTKRTGAYDLSMTFGGVDWPIAYEDLM